MKKIFYTLGASLCSIQYLYAATDEDNGLLEGITGTDARERIRTGDLHIEDIPNVINMLINIFIGMAGTVAVVFVIIGAYQLLFGSIAGEHNKGKDTIIMALTGFGIAVLAWFIIQFLFDNFT